MRSASPFRAAAQSTILLVDDNTDGILARRSVLEELGYKVVPAGCGSEALKLVEKESFDLIITDYKMSPVNGLELIKRLRENGFGKPIILLTGFADNLGLKPDTTGADVVLQKSANEVVTLVRHTKRLLNIPRKPPASQGARSVRKVHSK
jgi:CheY-like chemotaxis protein